MAHDPFSYDRVWIADWDACSAAGDAAATWRAIRDRASAIAPDPNVGPVARALPAEIPEPLRLEALTLAACAYPAGGLDRAPLLCLAASKGNTGRLLDRLDPAQLLPAMPGGLNRLVAETYGWRHYRECCPVAACSTGLYALLAAADALEHGVAEEALCGAADASLQALPLAGFQRMGVLASTDRPQALARAATGFAPGEGAAVFRLTTWAQPSGWRVVAGIRLGDASHPTSCEDPQVLHRCLADLWQRCPEPDAIVTHATGTRVGDAYELAGLESGPWRTAHRVVCKPIIGHCLGASSAVELAAALHGPHRSIWKLGLGFGGHIAGVALRREDR